MPLEYKVLCRQFTLRVIDLETLSIEADIPQFLGQFAGVAIMFSMIHSLIAWAYFGPMSPTDRFAYACHFEQYQIATMMLVAGIFAVITWDAVFPDRRDIMVLSPLPITARTILLAKLAASGGILGLAILALNCFSGFIWPFVLGINGGLVQGFLRTLAAWWSTLIAASLFLYSSALALQGLGALLMSRRLYMRFSALMQVAAFAGILSTYFLQGTLTSPTALAAPQNNRLLACSPSFWFFAVFNQLRGVLPPELAWIARRGWVALGLALCNGLLSLVLCYFRTMKKTTEEPDLLPAKRGFHWAPRLGGLQALVTLFSLRTLLRSRHHRVILAFYLSIVFAIALAAAHRALVAGQPFRFSSTFPSITNLMMVISVIGFRKVFSIPISLTANWVLRTTQIHPSGQFVTATRNTLLLFAVVPIWILSAVLGLSYRPIPLVAEHLLVLMLIGVILVDLSLIRFHKVPFTCSLLPGSTNFQLVFWAGLAGYVLLSVFVITCEMPALYNPHLYGLLIVVLGVIASCVHGFNRFEAKSAVLYFEEIPDEVLTTLQLRNIPVPAVASNQQS
jgi:hypothetical protein